MRHKQWDENHPIENAGQIGRLVLQMEDLIEAMKDRNVESYAVFDDFKQNLAQTIKQLEDRISQCETRINRNFDQHSHQMQKNMGHIDQQANLASSVKNEFDAALRGLKAENDKAGWDRFKATIQATFIGSMLVLIFLQIIAPAVTNFFDWLFNR